MSYSFSVSVDEELAQVCVIQLLCQCAVVHRKKVVCCSCKTGVPSKHSVLLVIVIAHDLWQKTNRV